MEPESSLPYSQVPATCPYLEPTPSIPQNPLPLPEVYIVNTNFNSKHFININSSNIRFDLFIIRLTY